MQGVRGSIRECWQTVAPDMRSPCICVLAKVYNQSCWLQLLLPDEVWDRYTWTRMVNAICTMLVGLLGQENAFNICALKPQGCTQMPALVNHIYACWAQSHNCCLVTLSHCPTVTQSHCHLQDAWGGGANGKHSDGDAACRVQAVAHRAHIVVLQHRGGAA